MSFRPSLVLPEKWVNRAKRSASVAMVAAVTGGPAVCVRRDGQEPRVRPPAQLAPTDRVAAGGVGVSMTPPAPLPTAGVTARKAG